jgi:hypothetical protein
MTLIISKGLTLDNGTRAAAIAGVSPTLDYRFAREKREIETVSLTDKLTYTGGNGTFVGSDGFIQPATTNVPRFDHDPISRQSLGLLSEASRENVLLRSEEFEAAWVPIAASILKDVEKSPKSTISADKIIASGGNTEHSVFQSFSVTSGLTYTFSCFLKAAERTAYTLAFRVASLWPASLNQEITFDLNSGTFVVTVGTATGSITAFGNGWFRCSVASTAAASGSAQVRVQSIFNEDGSGIYLWGAQLEAASTPSTYIPTTSAAVTRTADSAVIDGTGVLTGTYTLVEKPAGCAVVSGTNIELQPGFTAERVMVFPAALDAGQITAIRGAM